MCRKIRSAAFKFNFILVLLFSILFGGKADGQTLEPILKIHYLGHSAFVLQFDNGVSVVTDYGHFNAWVQWGWDSPIYDIGDFIPDIMTYSHFHEDHYDSTRIPEGVGNILIEFDTLNIDGIEIRPIRVCEGGLNTEDNSAFLFSYKGMKFLHLGDAQAQIMNIENEAVRDHIKEIIPDSLDLLFMTIQGQEEFIEEAELFVDLLKPRRIIPIHYWSTEYKMSFLSHLSKQNLFGKHYVIVESSSAKYEIYENDFPEPVKVISLTRSAFADVTSIEKNYSAPVEFKLNQNYPNPFNPTTIIKFTIPNVETTRRVVFTKLTIFDILGREITTLVSEEKRPGNYEVKFNSLSAVGGQGLSSGVYYYQIIAGNFSQTKKMILVQ